jgi:hypothetical protein
MMRISSLLLRLCRSSTVPEPLGAAQRACGPPRPNPSLVPAAPSRSAVSPEAQRGQARARSASRITVRTARPSLCTSLTSLPKRKRNRLVSPLYSAGHRRYISHRQTRTRGTCRLPICAPRGRPWTCLLRASLRQAAMMASVMAMATTVSKYRKQASVRPTRGPRRNRGLRCQIRYRGGSGAEGK